MQWTKVESINNGDRDIENRWILSLPGAGCSWAKKSEGCYMCNFKSATDKYTFGRLLPNGVFKSLYRVGHQIAKKHNPDSIIIFNGGSFLNDAEIPLGAQKSLCELISRNDNLKKIIFESRPEFVTNEKINLLKDIVGDRKLAIAIGLETKSDQIRSKSINKGFTRKNYEDAVDVINGNEAELLTYVFLKPLFLTENQAIDEAVDTIKYAFEIGSREVDLESATVVKGTKMEHYYDRGEYRPPWLWSIIKVVSETYMKGNLHVGGFDDNPPPKAIPFNCDRCSSKFPDLIEQFNVVQDVSVFENFDCQCKEQWQKELGS